MEREGIGFGIEVKNTWEYFPPDELDVKLQMCKFLGIKPLFIVRNRHAGQWQDVKEQEGMLYAFKSKLFPPGHDSLVQSIWSEMRLPVAILNDWQGRFYNPIGNYHR